MTPQDILNKLKKEREEIAALEAVWGEWFPEYQLPTKRQFQIWLKYSESNLELIVESFEAANIWQNKMSAKGEVRTQSDVIKYASACMRGDLDAFRIEPPKHAVLPNDPAPEYSGDDHCSMCACAWVGGGKCSRCAAYKPGMNNRA